MANTKKIQKLAVSIGGKYTQLSKQKYRQKGREYAERETSEIAR
jgi:hypothetical protein